MLYQKKKCIPFQRYHQFVPIIVEDRKSTRLNFSHGYISYAVFCLKKKKTVNATCIDYPPSVHRTALTTAIRCTILAHTNILIAVGVLLFSLATLGRKNLTANATQL